MKRRDLLLVTAASGFFCAGISFGQPKIPRIGFISGRAAPTPATPDPNGNFLKQELQKLGYTEGKNIRIEFRYAGGNPDRGQELCTELLRLPVDVLVIPFGPAIRSAQVATKTVPIVIILSGDPVAAGYVSTLARPGGNITGVTRLHSDLSGKRLEILKEVLPSITQAGYLFPRSPSSPEAFKQYEDAARALKLRLTLMPIDSQNPNYEAAIQAAVDARVEAIIVRREALFFRDQRRLFELIAKARLPAICEGAEETVAGGLFSYGSSDERAFRRAAVYVDKILRGTKPADLPIEQPMEFELVVNLRTAKALGITIPPTVMVRADRVIQ